MSLGGKAYTQLGASSSKSFPSLPSPSLLSLPSPCPPFPFAYPSSSSSFISFFFASTSEQGGRSEQDKHLGSHHQRRSREVLNHLLRPGPRRTSEEAIWIWTSDVMVCEERGGGEGEERRRGKKRQGMIIILQDLCGRWTRTMLVIVGTAQAPQWPLRVSEFLLYYFIFRIYSIIFI